MKKLQTTAYNLPTIRGFTLIELLVTIFIIGVLASILLANYRSAERNKKLIIAADVASNAVRNAQNFSLTSRQILASTCNQGKAPVSYMLFFKSNGQMELYGIDKCEDTTLIEAYTYPTNIELAPNGYKLNGNTVTSLEINFTTPYARIGAADSNSTPNTDDYNSFTSATVTIQPVGGGMTRTITIDGVSGRIGE